MCNTVKLTVDILRDFIDSLDLRIGVSSVVFDGTNSTVIADKLLHLRNKMSVTIDGVEYTVSAVDREARTFRVTGDVTGALTASIKPLFYIHGKPEMVNGSITMAKPSLKYPMVYIEEPREDTFQGETSAIEREASITMYVMDESLNGKWETKQHYDNVLRGLNELFALIVHSLLKDRCRFFFQNETYTLTNVSNLTGEGGSSLFNDNTTGIQARFNLPIKKCNI